VPDAVPPTTGGFGFGATAVGLGGVGVGVGVGLTGPSVFTGLGLADADADADAVADAVVTAAESDAPAPGLAEVLAEVLAADAAAEVAAGAGALVATADGDDGAAALNAAALEPAWLAGAELWCTEWLQAALRPARAAIMVAVTAVLGVRVMFHLRPRRGRSEAIRRPIWR
jgi:hypothetical protein